MTTRKMIAITYSGICILSLIAALIIICVISPRIRRTLFSIGHHVAPDVFVDRLRDKAYSKGDYDGIDVSKHQGVIKWEEVAKDKKIKFVYIRATKGKGYKDIKYKRNIREARKVGLKVGSYHFLTSKFSIDEQFRTFFSMAEPSKQDLIPMLDVENGSKGWLNGWNKEQLQDSVAKFCKLIEKHYGYKPMIYSNQHFYNSMLAPQFNNYVLYIANYHVMPMIKGMGGHNLWQYSEHGHIRGIGEYVDLCRFTNGTTVEDILLKCSTNICK